MGHSDQMAGGYWWRLSLFFFSRDLSLRFLQIFSKSCFVCTQL